jgi:hypothetical protein
MRTGLTVIVASAAPAAAVPATASAQGSEAHVVASPAVGVQMVLPDKTFTSATPKHLRERTIG